MTAVVERDIEGIRRFVRWLKEHDVGVVLAHEHQQCVQLSEEEVEEFLALYREEVLLTRDTIITPAETPEAKRKP